MKGNKHKKLNPLSKIEIHPVLHEGRILSARKLTVQSEIPIAIDAAWANVKTPALLQFVAKGMITFKSANGPFPIEWQVGKTYGVKMRIFGFIPFGGIHYLSIQKIDDVEFKISTKEWDNSAKIWNHDVTMKDLGNGSIYYEDSILIYGGMLTRFITLFAKKFYTHRQKRWQLVAGKKLTFGN